MQRRSIATVIAALLLVSADRADDAVKEVEKAIRALNDAFAARDVDTIKRLTADDHVAITPYYPVQNKGEQLRSLDNLKLTEYTSGKIDVKLITTDVALITYPLTQKGTYKGKALAAKSIASAVWVKRHGKWVEIAYQETALAE